MARITRREFLKATGTAAAGIGLLAIPGSKESKAAIKPAYSTLLPQTILGKTGVQVSRLGLGTANWIQDAPASSDAAIVAAINYGIDSGITVIDTANNYDDGVTKRAVTRVGMVMATRRSEVFLALAVEADPSTLGNRPYDVIMSQVNSSLAKLQTDHVDLLMLHYINVNDNVDLFGNVNGGYWTLQQLKAQGVTRFIGMSGHPNEPGLAGYDFTNVRKALLMYDWDCFLGFFNPEMGIRSPSTSSISMFQDQLPVARSKNMGVLAMKPLGGLYRSDGIVGTGPYQAPAADLLRYALSSPRGQNVDVIIPGIDSLAQLQANIQTVQNFVPMTSDETAAVEQAVGNVSYIINSKRKTDTSSVTVIDSLAQGMIVTRIFSDGFYVENADRSAGIKVKNRTTTLGYRLKVAGTMATDTNGERYVNATVNPTVISTGATVAPLEMTNAAVAGADFALGASNAGQRGCAGGSGLNTVGLLVKTTGTVTPGGTGYFYIDDGSRVVNETSSPGLRIDCTGLTAPTSGYVSVVGIATLYASGGNFYACIRVKNQSDINTLA